MIGNVLLSSHSSFLFLLMPVVSKKKAKRNPIEKKGEDRREVKLLA
jgi:hypothetical protein